MPRLQFISEVRLVIEQNSIPARPLPPSLCRLPSKCSMKCLCQFIKMIHFYEIQDLFYICPSDIFDATIITETLRYRVHRRWVGDIGLIIYLRWVEDGIDLFIFHFSCDPRPIQYRYVMSLSCKCLIKCLCHFIEIIDLLLLKKFRTCLTFILVIYSILLK